MRRALADGYELDDDAGRIDTVAVHAFLTNVYWAEGRTLEAVRALNASAARVVGLYHDGVQVGYARVLSDLHTTCMLFDVYVLPEHRGRGLGIELVRDTVDGDPQLAPLKWVLHTRDMHGLYRRFGFHEPSERVMERN
jgi:GNAT superfamily N-acetyltransferase